MTTSPNDVSKSGLRAALEASKDGTTVPPHSFQIPLPSSMSSTQVDTVTNNKSSLSPSMMTFSTEGLLLNVPAPVYSAVVATLPEKVSTKNILVSSISTTPVSPTVVTATSGKPQVISPLATKGGSVLTGQSGSPVVHNQKQELSVTPIANSSIVDKNISASSDHYVEDTSHDPCPDYQPIIPLPATVEVVTGEENENVLFEEKARLFRFVDKEWKERGLGPIKILHNAVQGTTRVLMRRDQTLKVCCNHLIQPSMELTPMKDNDKALLWAAQDFADEELRVEKFCCRFKTLEIAQAFKIAFNKGQEIAAKSPKKATEIKSAVATPQSSLSEMFKPAEGSWTCNTCLVLNSGNASNCVACQGPNPNASPSAIKSNTAASSTTTTPAFKFGLGTVGDSNKNSLFTNSSMTSNSTFAFGNTSSKPSLSFGISGSKPFNLSPSVTITPAKGPSPSVFGTATTTTDSKHYLQGFSFTSPPTISTPNIASGNESGDVSKKEMQEQSKKPSIFSSFQFKGVSPVAADEVQPIVIDFKLPSSSAATVTSTTNVKPSTGNILW